MPQAATFMNSLQTECEAPSPRGLLGHWPLTRQAICLWLLEATSIKLLRTGARTTFASGLFDPGALAFDSAGNLFVADRGFDYDFVSDAAVYKFTPSGLRSTVASQNDKVQVSPGGLAIDSADNLFVANGVIPGSILKFTPSGVRTTFAARMVTALAFQPTLTPTPTAAISDFNGDGHSDYVLYNRF